MITRICFITSLAIATELTIHPTTASSFLSVNASTQASATSFAKSFSLLAGMDTTFTGLGDVRRRVNSGSPARSFSRTPMHSSSSLPALSACVAVVETTCSGGTDCAKPSEERCSKRFTDCAVYTICRLRCASSAISTVS